MDRLLALDVATRARVLEGAAATAGVPFHELDCGHWWQLERPAQVAAILTAHWAGATDRPVEVAG